MKKFYIVTLIILFFPLILFIHTQFYESRNQISDVNEIIEDIEIYKVTDESVNMTSNNAIENIEKAYQTIENLNSSYDFLLKDAEEDFYKEKDIALRKFFKCIEQYLLEGNGIDELVQYGISVTIYHNNCFFSEKFGEAMLLVYSYNDESVYSGATTLSNWQFLLADFSGNVKVIPIIEESNFYPQNCYFQEIDDGILICTYGFIRWGMPPPGYIVYWIYDGEEVRKFDNFNMNILKDNVFELNIIDNSIYFTNISDENVALNYLPYEKNGEWHLNVIYDSYSLDLFYSKENYIYIVRPLTDEDFILEDDYNYIGLGKTVESIKTNSAILEPYSINEKHAFDSIIYEDFKLKYSPNKNNGEIFSVELITPVIKTSRGIKVGDSILDVFEKYGAIDNENDNYIYRYEHKFLMFCVDSDNKITKIVLEFI